MAPSSIVEKGWDLQKMRPDPGFRKDFPHYWALPVQWREGWGPLGVAKSWLLGIGTLGKIYRFLAYKHRGGAHGALCGAYTTPDQPTLVGLYVTVSGAGSLGTEQQHLCGPSMELPMNQPSMSQPVCIVLH